MKNNKNYSNYNSGQGNKSFLAPEYYNDEYLSAAILASNSMIKRHEKKNSEEKINDSFNDSKPKDRTKG